MAVKLYPAPLSRRLWAFLLDYLILSLGASILIFPLGWAVELTGAEKIGVPLLIIFILAYLFYIPIMETFNAGRTIGKLALGIRTVRSDGSPASGTHCFIRYLMMVFDLPFTLGLGGLTSALITKRRQRLGDLVADTMVVISAPQGDAYAEGRRNFVYFTPYDQREFNRIVAAHTFWKNPNPAEAARSFQALQSAEARMRTRKSHPALLEYVRGVISAGHVNIFNHRYHTFTDMVAMVLRSVPRAIYECRREILISLAICTLSYIIGWATQYSDATFADKFLGSYYMDMTRDNITSGNPMGVYAHEAEWPMFRRIFLNNFGVATYTFIFGILTVIGPLYILSTNFMSLGVFDCFFAQQGLLIDALIIPNEHGTLEMLSIVICGGAALRLGIGWLFPGRLKRLKALARSARQSFMVYLSTVPMILVAAIIESFITRHTEWPMAVKLSIIVASFLFIVFYYVMLPIYSRRK